MKRVEKQIQEQFNNVMSIVLKARYFDQLCETASMRIKTKTNVSQLKVKHSSKKPFIPSQKLSAYRVYSFLQGRRNPATAERISKGIKLGTGTVKQYLHQYDCFQNIRGRGYIVVSE